MSFIALLDYFGDHYEHPAVTAETLVSAQELLDKVNGLLVEAEAHNVDLRTNPRTGTYVSAGFSPDAAGARTVDVFDPDDGLDSYVTDAILTAHDLYRQPPRQTPRFCRLTDRAPKSGKRTYLP